MHSQQPVIDDKNPFYCPALDAVAFLQNLRHQLHSGAPVHIPNDCLPSFAECLDRSLDEDELHELSCRIPPHLAHSPDVSDLTFSAFFCNQSTPVPHQGWKAAPLGFKAKRKRPMSPDTFSDMLAPSKKEKSFQSINESSFELSARADKLRYSRGSHDALYSPYPPKGFKYSVVDARPTAFELERKIRALEGECILSLDSGYILTLTDELYGPPVGTETPHSLDVLTARFDALLPGIRLKERLRGLGACSHQHIADILAIDGE